MAMLPDLKSDRLRMQLSTVDERFAGFKNSIADDSRKRKQVDEQRYQVNLSPQGFHWFAGTVLSHAIPHRANYTCLRHLSRKEIKESILAVEKTLNQEIKRRVDANKALQQISEQMANEMLDRLQLRIVKYIESLTVSPLYD